ncbi:response regulator [Phaeovulum sp.]|uniref:response regulator n=1 Tax=Phaeovulum sp. TaxID=2934796 RepID=UPI0039E69F99
MKILAVDDDTFILELIPMISAKVGFPDVTAVSSAQLALDELKSSDVAFDCLLVDIQMPGMDGIELCRHVRALSAYRKTPIIMLTAMTEKDYIDRAFKAGATDYASKPFDMVELGARLRMAQQLVHARRDAAVTGGAGKELSGPANPGQESGQSDDVRIDGIKNIIDYTALGNYLMQLSRAGLAGSQVIAVKIDQIEAIGARASAEEFVYALTEVADAISDVLRSSGYMMAYAGNGAFVVISGKPSVDPSIGLEIEIQNLLDEKGSEYDNGDPLDIEVSVGNPIRPNSSETQGDRQTFERAIARAETRAIKKQSEPRPVSFRFDSGEGR